MRNEKMYNRKCITYAYGGVRKKRITAVITCLIAIAGVLCGCNIFDNRTYHWKFEQEYSAAKEILIVDVSCDDGIYREELLKNLSLESAKDIFHDIEAIDFKKYGPNQLTTHGRCIKIVFENGDYDLIGAYEPIHHYYGNTLGDDFASYLVVRSAEQFDALIDSYLAE